MPKFVTIGFGDEAGYQETALEIRNAAHQHDEILARAGALIGVAGAPVQVRNPDAKGIQTEPAAFMSSPLPIAGFAIIEAADIAEASRWFPRLRALLRTESWRSGRFLDHRNLTIPVDLTNKRRK